MFRCRIVSTDHYLCDPHEELDIVHSDFWNSSVKTVPILRIYGITPDGQKTCMHVHGVSVYRNTNSELTLGVVHEW